ncbi:MAG: hypothetical protein IJZ74_04165 [Clostridia bacterium]|nr:hypothetical protein [Clostridia bacterium]
MKRIFAMLLSILLLLTPAISNAELVSAPIALSTEAVLSAIVNEFSTLLKDAWPSFSASLTSEGKTLTLGTSVTADNQPAVNAAFGDHSLLLSGNRAFLTDTSGVSAIDFETLLEGLLQMANGGQALPSVTEEDLQTLYTAAMAILSGISTNAVNVTTSGSTAALVHIDLDALLSELNTAVPAALTSHQPQLDNILARFVTPYAGISVTTAELISLWQQLNLGSIHTGVKADMTFMYTGNALNIVGTMMNCVINATVSSNGASFSVSVPGGKTYSFDTADLMTIASIFSSVPNSIGADAIALSEERTDTSFIRTYQFNPSNFLRSLINGVDSAITANSLQLDMLLNKYRPWIELFVTDASSLTAAQLQTALRSLNIPDTDTATLVLTYNQTTRTCLIDGEYDVFHLNGAFISPATLSLTLSADLPKAPFTLSLNYAYHYRSGTTLSISSSLPILGCHTLTYQAVDRSNTTYHLTTDNDLLHFHYDEDEQYLDVKLGDISFYLQEEDLLSVSFLAGEWYSNLIIGEDHFDLDTSLFGMDVTTDLNSLTINGYFLDEYNDRHTFFLTYNSEAKYLTGYYQNPDDSTGIHLTYRTGRLEITASNNTLAITDVTPAESTTENVVTIALDDQVLYTIISSKQIKPTWNLSRLSNLYDIRIYEAENTVSPALYTLQLDFAPSAVTIPTDVQLMTPQEFINKLNSIF